MARYDMVTAYPDGNRWPWNRVLTGIHDMNDPPNVISVETSSRLGFRRWYWIHGPRIPRPLNEIYSRRWGDTTTAVLRVAARYIVNPLFPKGRP